MNLDKSDLACGKDFSIALCKTMPFYSIMDYKKKNLFCFNMVLWRDCLYVQYLSQNVWNTAYWRSVIFAYKQQLDFLFFTPFTHSHGLPTSTCGGFFCSVIAFGNLRGLLDDCSRKINSLLYVNYDIMICYTFKFVCMIYFGLILPIIQ